MHTLPADKSIFRICKPICKLCKNHANEYVNFANQYADYASQASACSFDMIAEYVPGSDVTQHSRLDLDQVTS